MPSREMLTRVWQAVSEDMLRSRHRTYRELSVDLGLPTDTFLQSLEALENMGYIQQAVEVKIPLSVGSPHASH